MCAQLVHAQSHESRYRQKPTIIHHYDKGFSPLFRVYLTDILKTTLDKSIEEYGPYKIQFYSKHLSTNRSKLEAEKGVLLDLLFASHWYGRFVDSRNMIAVNLPIFNGLLGLRSAILTDKVNPEFSQIQSKQDFEEFTAGQGANWEDVKILKANQIDVIEAQHFDALFPMLAKGRYDYLPLSNLEAQTALSTKGVRFGNLQTNKDVSMYYPLPFYLFVNGNRPELAERLQRGFEVAVADGSIDRLFDKHFGFIKPELNQKVKKLVLLRNPLLSDDENAEFTEQFLDKYQQHFEVIH